MLQFVPCWEFEKVVKKHRGDRRVRFVNPEDGHAYVFLLTNIMHLPARQIADIYKERWQVELFFKWIKERLEVNLLKRTLLWELSVTPGNTKISDLEDRQLCFADFF